MAQKSDATLDIGNTSIDGDTFVVLRNDEGQHSLWPAGTAIPDGWQQVNGPAARAECLAFVEAHWTDMRPRSLLA